MSSKDSRIPVTIITGFLGSGKTTLVNNLLANPGGARIAVIENDFGEFGIDADLVTGADGQIIDLSNGCICCSINSDLVDALDQLYERRDRFDHLVIETTGVADPAPVITTLLTDQICESQYRLVGLVTVVDAVNFLDYVQEEPVCADQVACANMILLNKCDLLMRTI